MTAQGSYPNPSRSNSNSNSSSIKSSSRSAKSVSTVFQNKLSVSKEYGGLGHRYYEKLSNDLDKILQVDIVNHSTETRGSVRVRAIRLAVAMSQKGINHDDIVVICSSSQADQTIAVLATLFIGAIVAPLDPYFDFKDACQLMRKLKPKLIFTDARMCSQIERILMTLNYSTPICDFSRGCFDASFFKLPSIGEEVVLDPIFIEDPRGSVAFIMPTQGTTGPPKLVCLSHHSIYIQTLIFIDIFDNPDKVLSFFPLSLLLQIILLCVSFESTTTIFFPGAFSERNACKFIYDYQISHAAFGTDYAMKVVHGFALKDYNINCLKSVMIGASNTTKQDIMRLQRNMPDVKFLQYYFMTECGCITATKISNYTLSLDKPGSAGTLTFNSKIKIVDMTTKEVVGPNTLGEVYYKGEGLMLGYFKDNDGTLASMEKGYFKTGDLGMYDDDGWFYFQERIEDIIIRDGEILCPSLQLEDLIISHPNIIDAVVIGNDKEIIAILKKISGADVPEESIRKYIASKCREKNRPTKIIFLDSFPKTSLGHVKRRVLKKAYLEIEIKHTDSLASINL